MTGDWQRRHRRGRAGELHGLDLLAEPRRAIWWLEVERPAIVLGSAQRDTILDRAEADRNGIDIVRRRSGGGAVWLDPVSITWIDVILPVGDPLWADDVGRAGLWLGEVWCDALADLGVDGAEVYRGPMRRDPVAQLVCFAGLTAGELIRGDRKIVGVSARRTRHGARFQCSVLHEWNPDRLLSVLDLDGAEREVLADRARRRAAGVGAVPAEQIVAAVHERLPTS